MDLTHRLALLLLLAGTACGDSKAASPRNHCKDDGDCVKSARCDLTRSQCIATATDTPYEIVLQVATPSAEPGQIARHTFPIFEFGATDRKADLTIPTGLSLKGSVSFDDKGIKKAVRTQLVFLPESERGLPVASVTTSSLDELEGDQNFSVSLTPNTQYNVMVYPLGPQSTRFPPLSTRLDTSGLTDATPLNFLYFEDPATSVEGALVASKLETFDGFLIDEDDAPLSGHWVRVVEIDGATRRVASSIGVVKEDGALKLFVQDGVLARKTYVFEIDLDDQNAWSTVIEADATHIDASNKNTITIPVIPRYVRYQGSVKSSELATLPSTNLTFVSDFTVPDVLGEVGDRDFCRATLPSETKTSFKCRSTRQGATDSAGLFSVMLLPGDYRVFLSPTQDTENVDRATTQATSAVIETQPADLPQQGQLYMLRKGSRYSAAVRTGELEPLDNVPVGAIALGLPGSVGEVATFNRSSEAVTDDQGEFELAVDVGYYDLVARPSPAVGFSWDYVANLAIEAQSNVFKVTGFVLPTPLLLAGTLTRNQQIVAGASVDAYAMVEDLDQGKRAVLIGQTTTDAQGHYSLLLTSAVKSAEGRPQPPAVGSE